MLAIIGAPFFFCKRDTAGSVWRKSEDETTKEPGSKVISLRENARLELEKKYKKKRWPENRSQEDTTNLLRASFFI